MLYMSTTPGFVLTFPASIDNSLAHFNRKLRFAIGSSRVSAVYDLNLQLVVALEIGFERWRCARL